MRCPYCGAETQNQICEFCGSEIPQEKANINITNNYYGNVTQQSSKSDTFVGKCPNCGSTNINFKRERIETTTQSISRKSALGLERKGQSVSQATYRTVGLCQNCGYTWNPNISSSNVGKKRTPIWVWVLGWICIFPLPLSILLLRKKDMKPALKYGIIATAWIIYLFIGLFGDSENTNKTPSNQTDNVQIEQTMNETQEEIVDSTESKNSEVANNLNSYISNIIEQYNSQATEKLVFVENFTPSDKSSSHYRTEFRLGAYDDAIGKSYLLGDKVVDLVASKTIMEDVNFRVYTTDVSLEQVKALMQGMSPLMDKTLSAADLNAAINEVNTKKTADGYYYGELGITLLGSDEKGYELMIKND